MFTRVGQGFTDRAGHRRQLWLRELGEVLGNDDVHLACGMQLFVSGCEVPHRGFERNVFAARPSEKPSEVVFLITGESREFVVGGSSLDYGQRLQDTVVEFARDFLAGPGN